MSDWKRACGWVISVWLALAGLFLAFHYPPLVEQLSALLSELVDDAKNLYQPIVTSLVAAVFLAILTGTHARTFRILMRRLFSERTDEQITGLWYVYRYSRKHGKDRWLDETWKIRRDFSNNYAVKSISSPAYNDSLPLSGRVVYKERDRLNVLVTGQNHKQQSHISFRMTIPTPSDTRLLGVGIGDDADYVISARIYFASRTKLERDYVEPIIREATECLRSSGDGLLQLPDNVISDIFARHPLPPPPAEGVRWNWASMLAGLQRLQKPFPARRRSWL